ncbi:peptidoglycan editing factor PgeF [Hydrogenimonas sp.]
MTARTLFTDRWGGVGEAPYDTFNLAFHVGDDPAAVAVNRQILQQRHKTPPIVWMEQVHGDTVRRVETAELDTLPACDALATDRPGVALAVMVADCLPILLHDPVRHAVATVHAGRNGTLLNVAVKTVEKMGEWYGTRPENLVVRIGPAIGVCCYEVNEEIAAIVRKTHGERYVNGRSLDLKTLNRDLLVQAGIKPENIEISDICTRCGKDYFSYRREKKTGRFAGVIWLEE